MAIENAVIYVGLLTLFMLVLGARVSLLRQKYQVSMGSGDQPELTRALRVFGNFTEWVPMILLGLVLCEFMGAPPLLIHLVGIAVILGRLGHLIGLHQDRTTSARGIGVLLTWLSALTTGGYLVYASVV